MLYTSNSLPSIILAKNLAVLEIKRANYYTAGEWAQYILSCDSSFTDGAIEGTLRYCSDCTSNGITGKLVM